MEAATIEMTVIPAGTAETKRELRIKEYHYKLWILIRDTTREERERIVGESIGNINGFCDGCAHGLAEMYQEYIDGKKEIRDIHIWNITDLFLCIGE